MENRRGALQEGRDATTARPSNWVGFAGRLGEVNGLLGIPDQLDVLAILPFGYPATPVGRGKKNRKPLAETASRERFG